MPSILSKQFYNQLLGSEWSFGYNCYEVGHTWTPSCTDAALEVSAAACTRVLPLYVMLYVFSQVAIQRKYDLRSTLTTVASVLRSSGFIFFHTYNGSLLGCAFRRGFGRFYYRILVCAPALISSFMSLLIEKKARRQALAFYLLNLSSEIVFRMSVDKGYLKPIKYGETLVFALSLSAWYYFIKKNGFGHDPISMVVKTLIGRYESKSRSKAKVLHKSTTLGEENINSVISDKTLSLISCAHVEGTDKEKQKFKDGENVPLHDQITKSEETMPKEFQSRSYLKNFLTAIPEIYLAREIKYYLNHKLDFMFFRNECCPHRNSCLRYVLSPIPTRFMVGYTIQLLLKISSKPLLLIQDPRMAIVSALKSSRSVRFGMFIATLVASGRLVHCYLRYHSNSNDKNWHALVSGFVAGLSMSISPRSSISMYIMWKAVEQYYLQAAKEKRVHYFDFTILLIYSMSAATILYTFALEPRYVRPSYMKFLDNLSNHRLHQLNRMVLDVFGTGASIGYEDYFPDLDPRFMSNQFKELIFNWMIQPYE